MKEGSLFVCFVCTYKIQYPGSWSLWKALKEEGASARFQGVWTCGAKVIEY